MNGVEHLDVFIDGAFGLPKVCDDLAEHVDGRAAAERIEFADARDRLADRVAGDVAAGCFLNKGARNQGDGVRHQCIECEHRNFPKRKNDDGPAGLRRSRTTP